jgi:hypothetical protein
MVIQLETPSHRRSQYTALILFCFHDFGQQFSRSHIEVYICTVHTAVLFQSLAGIYCQTQHVEY